MSQGGESCGVSPKNLDLGFDSQEIESGAPGGDRPLIIWDGDCGFCRRSALHMRAVTDDRVAYAPYQRVADRLPEIPVEQFREAVHLVEPDGRVTRGAEAILRAYATVPSRRWMLWSYSHLPGIRAVFDFGYRRVARNRGAVSWLTQMLSGSHIGLAQYQLTRWVFLRLLGLIYLAAFLSLGSQIVGLVGEQGILPIGDRLDLLDERLGSSARWYVPTLCWLSGSDAMLTGLWTTGAILSVLLVIGVAPIPILVALYVLYLSLYHAGQVFLSFQWDILLLETGFLAIFLAPRHLLPRRPGREAPPSRAVVWFFRLLLFKLMFSSGITKLTWDDATWWDLTALTYHYWSQPIPTPAAWWAHHLPLWFQKLSCVLMYAAELGAPFLIIAPLRLRMLGFTLMAGLMVLISITGNYGFFNLLAIALCVMMLDDVSFPRRFRAWARSSESSVAWWPRVYVIAPVAVLVLLLNVAPLTRIWNSPRITAPDPLLELSGQLQPFSLVSGYGLFRTMTTTRPEIFIEGSMDGETWLAYDFKYKPGDPARAPRFFQPHMPRVDWQMWFAALSLERLMPHGEEGVRVAFQGRERWLLNLCERLLDGEETVLALLESTPFPDEPPQFIRLSLWQYRFTDAGSEEWWSRSKVGDIAVLQRP